MKTRINRRQFIKAAGLGAASLAIHGCSNAAQLSSGPNAAGKQNIILIMADDIGYECFGCYGGTSYKTPVLDELAKKYKTRLKIAKINVDENQGVSSRYNIASIPTMFLIKDGKIFDTLVGALPKEALESQIARIL